MSDPLPPIPQAPAWRVDWAAIDRAYAWIQALAGCPQDAHFHTEGDAWVHTRLVCEALAASPSWRSLPDDERKIVFTAALLHDVAKPVCTRVESDGRISARGHASRGAILARRIMWRLDVPIHLREQVAALVRYHQVPFYLLARPDAQRLAFQVSQAARCDHLAILAAADARGRECRHVRDKEQMLENVALFVEYCREHGCLDAPRAFPSDHSRFLYFQREGRDPTYHAFERFRAEVVLMSGLPGAGKDHWIRDHLPGWTVVALDDLRQELAVKPAAAQGPVVARARRLAGGYLREGRSFVWNATNLSRQIRRECVGLFAGYDARIRIVYLEASAARLYRQNRQRPRPVPEAVIERLLDRWEIPDRTEAHQVDWVVSA